MHTKIPVWLAFSVVLLLAAGSALIIETQCSTLSRETFTASGYTHIQMAYNRKKASGPSIYRTHRKPKLTTTTSGTTPTAPETAPSPAPEPTPTDTPSPAPVDNHLAWGVFNGWRATDLAAFESKVGADVDMQAVFVHWGNENEFPAAVAAGLKPYNKTLVIFWEAMDYNFVRQPCLIETGFHTCLNCQTFIVARYENSDLSFFM